VQTEAYERYRDALTELSPRDREMIVARIEAQWSHAEIAKRFGIPTPDAAPVRSFPAFVRCSRCAESGAAVPGAPIWSSGRPCTSVAGRTGCHRRRE